MYSARRRHCCGGRFAVGKPEPGFPPALIFPSPSKKLQSWVRPRSESAELLPSAGERPNCRAWRRATAGEEVIISVTPPSVLLLQCRRCVCLSVCLLQPRSADAIIQRTAAWLSVHRGSAACMSACMELLSAARDYSYRSLPELYQRNGSAPASIKARLKHMNHPRARVTVTRPTQPCIPPGSLNRVPCSFGWGNGVNVTSAGWQVTPCNPIWHVSSRSGAATLRTCYITLHYELKSSSQQAGVCSRRTN